MRPFLGRLGRGSDVRLRTADKVLAYMKLEPIGPRFLRKVDAFLKVTGVKPHVLGEGAVGDPQFRAQAGAGTVPDARDHGQGGRLDWRQRKGDGA